MKHRLIYLLSLLFVLSCEDTTPIRDNPLDEEGGDYIAPIVGLLDIVDGDILYSESIEFGEKAIAKFNELIDIFPKSEFVKIAQKHIVELKKNTPNVVLKSDLKPLLPKKIKSLEF